MANAGLHKVREDDVLECFLYPKICYTANPDEVTEALLNEEIVKYNQEIEPFVKDYIWHRDALTFRARTKQALLLDKILEGSISVDDFQTLPHIYINLGFDEDIGDEWFTVFLIQRLTKTFPGLIARLVDSDGEFLLIEAANVLPMWANPELCQDRVFIYNGSIHVMRERGTSLYNLLNNIVKDPLISKMSDKVQMAVQKRILIYPDEIKRRKHKCRAYLPEKAASILKQEPGLVASVVRSICHSDPLERKVCRAMKYFPPEQRTMVNVRMTRCLYAMMTHCRYTGDPRTGWNLPPTSSSKYNAYVLGVKIACGLEMLVARANENRRKREKIQPEEKVAQKQVINESAFNAYIARLENSGYFRETLQGSKEHESLLHIAKEHFLSHGDLPNCSVQSVKSDAEKVLEAWENVHVNDTEMHDQDENNLSPANSDSWLNVDPAELEVILSRQWNEGKKVEQEQMSLREKVQAFLNHASDYDGVQYLEEQIANDDEKRDADDGGKIEFDADVFDNTLRGILDLVVPGSEGEFDGSSEGSLGGDDEEKAGEMDKYMRLLDSELQKEMVKDENVDSKTPETIEANLLESMECEAGGSGPTGNIIGGPVRRFMHLQLQSPTKVPPDLQS